MRSVLAAVLVLAALVAPAARAATVGLLSVYSDAGDFIGQGVPRVAHPGGPAVSAGTDPLGDGGIALGAVTGQEGVGVEIAPPPGEGLRPHNWTRTDRYPFQYFGPARPHGPGRQSRVQRGWEERRGARRRLR